MEKSIRLNTLKEVYFMIIYKLMSPSGKIYIGQTKQDLNARWQQHIRDWRRCKRQSKPYHELRCSTKLLYAFDRHPPELWSREVLQVCNSHEELNESEIRFIRELKSIEFGYNILPGGKSRVGIKLSEETKRKISKANKGRKLTEETKQRHRNKIVTNITREKIRQARIGVKRSLETCEKIRQARLGIKKSPETVAKMLATRLRNKEIKNV